MFESHYQLQVEAAFLPESKGENAAFLYKNLHVILLISRKHGGFITSESIILTVLAPIKERKRKKRLRSFAWHTVLLTCTATPVYSLQEISPKFSII